jgi:hypothetical protein
MILHPPTPYTLSPFSRGERVGVRRDRTPVCRASSAPSSFQQRVSEWEERHWELRQPPLGAGRPSKRNSVPGNGIIPIRCKEHSECESVVFCGAAAPPSAGGGPVLRRRPARRAGRRQNISPFRRFLIANGIIPTNGKRDILSAPAPQSGCAGG